MFTRLWQAWRRPSSKKLRGKRQKTHATRLRLEPLERRELMAFDVASLTGLAATGGNAYGFDIAQDADGDTYLAGTLLNGGSNSVVGIDLDPNQSYPDNKDLITSNVGQSVAFLAKYLPDGTLDWVGRIDGGVVSNSLRIAVAPQTGGIYFAGSFMGQITTSAGSFSAGNDVDRIIGKLDASGGLTWAQQVDRAPSENFTGSLVADEARGRLYLAGEQMPTNPGTSQGVVLALDVANPGTVTVAWSATLAPTSRGLPSAYANGLAIDSLGNPIVVGQFAGKADFDPGSGSFNLDSGGTKSNPLYTGFVWKLNVNGSFGWARKFEVAAGGSCTAKAVALDAANNIYVGGQFKGTVDFQPGSGTRNLTSAGGYDSFVVKMAASGATTYATRYGGASDDYLAAMALDGSTVYITGWTRAGAGPVTSAYVAALDANSGALQSQAILAGAAVPKSLSARNGQIHVTGMYTGPLDAGAFHADTGDTTSDPFWLVLTT